MVIDQQNIKGFTMFQLQEVKIGIDISNINNIILYNFVLLVRIGFQNIKILLIDYLGIWYILYWFFVRIFWFWGSGGDIIYNFSRS